MKVKAARGMAALVFAVLAPVLLAQCSAKPPPDVEGQALRYTLAWKNVSGEEPGSHDQGLWARLVPEAAELEPWSPVGSAPKAAADIPDGVTVVYFNPGPLADGGQYFEVTGVFDDDGDWVVAIDREDRGGASIQAIVDGTRGVLFVEAPPPNSVAIRVENHTDAAWFEDVEWG
ncbi:MAG: hypothetical protein LBH68_07240 [Bifidobacteriaceae bacterium]|jgi:hypothetical protein|nr:hypothetical protein [Bifidobacteriaceae bacterium]